MGRSQYTRMFSVAVSKFVTESLAYIMHNITLYLERQPYILQPYLGHN